MGRLRVCADEGACPKRERSVRIRIPQQFPRNGGGLTNAGGHLDACLREAALESGPQLDGVARLEDVAEQLPADLSHSLFDAGGDRGGGLLRELEEVFEIPTQVGLVLVGQGKSESCGGGLAGLVGEFERDLYAELVLLDHALGQPENWVPHRAS